LQVAASELRCQLAARDAMLEERQGRVSENEGRLAQLLAQLDSQFTRVSWKTPPVGPCRSALLAGPVQLLFHGGPVMQHCGLPSPAQL
jgi:hypothetical protein